MLCVVTDWRPQECEKSFRGLVHNTLGMPNEPFRALPKTLPDRSQSTARNLLRNHRCLPRPEILSRNRCFRKPCVDMYSGVD